jgi:ATP-dependent DNA ligase
MIARAEQATAVVFLLSTMFLPLLLPMLALPATPFDSSDFSFEIKWNGIRALAAVETAGWRLWGRERADYGARYPELEVLRRLPAGTLVDGELVALDADGRPDLPRLLRRHGVADPWRIRQARHWCITRDVACCVSRWRGGGKCWPRSVSDSMRRTCGSRRELWGPARRCTLRR